jgi:riboflavin kinase / FMN adenylyltransferase
MGIFYSLNKFKNSSYYKNGVAATVGVFDGVHSAHQKVINVMKKRGKLKNISTVAVTFYPHPTKVITNKKNIPLLISLSHRIKLLLESGAKNVIVLKFNKKFSRMNPTQFIDLIVKKINIKELIVGDNFFFGSKKEGGIRDLKRLSKTYGYNVTIVKSQKRSGKVISSTRIRSLIQKGDLKNASKLLSRPVTVLGTVVRGLGRGRFIGFPTANINPHHEAIPPAGVYAVMVKFGSKLCKGVLNIGTRPTFHSYNKELEPSIEVHIFDFKKSIYGKELEISFVKKLRNEKRFKNIELLKRQIMKDARQASLILSGRS